MTSAITAAGVSVVGSAIIANQQRQAAKGAANAQASATKAATQVERERLQQEAQQYQQQMLEYQRKQAMLEKQQAQTLTNLAPYIQGGQGALYEMLALSGISPPAGATPGSGDFYRQTPTGGGLGIGIGSPAPTAPTAPGKMGILSGGVPPSGTPDFYNQAQAEFQKGGRSLSAKAWQTTTPDASPRAAAAYALQKAREENPNATVTEQHNIAKSGLAGDAERAYIDESLASMPTVETAANPYAGMTGAQSQQAAIDRISQSPLLQELMSQGETGILQNAAATGGLRGGRTQAALAQFRPQMLQQEIDKQYARLQGLSGMGQQSILGSPTTAVGAMPSYSANTGTLSNLLTQGGAIQAGGILSNAQNQQQLLHDIGKSAGWGLEKYSQGGFVQPQQTPTALPAYANYGIGNPGNY
jgi:hypothetical protein